MFLENNCIQISPIIFALEVTRERPTRLVERSTGATELKNSRTTEWTAERHAAAAAGIEGILLRRIAKLGSTTPGDVQRQLSKKQQRDHFPDAAATRAALDRLAVAGRIVKTGEGKGATYALAGNKPSKEEG